MAINLPDLDSLRRRAADALADVWTTVAAPPAASDAREIAERAALSAPVVWLIGKVQSGKSSIVQALTESSEAEVGNGFRACTKTSRIFDYPADAPVIRFLDTRGLGEAGYDPAEDLAFAADKAHLLLVVMKAMDPAQDAVLDVVRAARRRHPDWPVLLVHTSLHDAYPPGRGHCLPYPFDASGQPTTELPGDLSRAIAWQKTRLLEIPGNGPRDSVAIDFTREGDGLEPRLYGLDNLLAALERVAPAAITAALVATGDEAHDVYLRHARPHIIGYATAAGAIDLFPVAGVVGVPGVQAKMLHSIAAIHGTQWDNRKLRELAGALGAGTLVRMLSGFGARQIAKLVPVYGQTAGAAAAAAMSFASTYALGVAASYYLASSMRGERSGKGVTEAYNEALKAAFDIAKARQSGGKTGT